MVLDLDTQTAVDFGTPAVPTYTNAVSVEDDGTTNNQVISSGPLAGVIDRSNLGLDAVVKIQGGSDSGTNRDDVFAFEVTYLDPGPQNF